MKYIILLLFLFGCSQPVTKQETNKEENFIFQQDIEQCLNQKDLEWCKNTCLTKKEKWCDEPK